MASATTSCRSSTSRTSAPWRSLPAPTRSSRRAGSKSRSRLPARSVPMAQTPSTMLPLGTPVPDFTLPNAVDGNTSTSTRLSPAARRCSSCSSATTARSSCTSAASSSRGRARRRRQGSRSSRSTPTTSRPIPRTAPRRWSSEAHGRRLRASRTSSTRPRKSRKALPRRLHARLLPLRRRAQARLPRPARRQPPRQRHARHRRGPARRHRRRARRQAPRPRAEAEHRLQHQVAALDSARIEPHIRASLERSLP